MKTILIFSLICFTLSVWGPVDKIKNSNSNNTCGYVGPESMSECVDAKLGITDEETGKTRYADRCCYVRFQYNGAMNSMCWPLREQEYMDITETIKEFEKDWGGDSTDGKDCKVYQFDCAASNIKYLYIAIVLLSLLF